MGRSFVFQLYKEHPVAIQFDPYISFPGNGREVMTYYQEIFGGELTAWGYDDFPDAQFPFTPTPGALAHAHLNGGAVNLAGGDAMTADAPSLSSDVYSFLISTTTVSESEQLIEKLVATGGTVAMPFEQAPWGGYYGQVKDKFGVLWAFSVDD